MNAAVLYRCALDNGHAVGCAPAGPAAVPWGAALPWAGAGAATLLIVSAVIACAVDRDNREALAGLVLAAVVAPFLAVLHGLRRLDLFGGCPVDPRALERFARMKYRGGGRALALFYTPGLGIIWVRGLRENEPVPPIRIRWPQERTAGDPS